MVQNHTLLYPEAVLRISKDLERSATDWSYLSSISGNGPVEEFENRFGRVAGGKFAIAMCNATSSLFTALIASGAGRGDEVILPAYTWPQTLTPLIMSGATPVFADIDKDTVTVSPESVKRLITKKTRAIIGVHLYGFPADVEKLGRIAKENNCTLIYDAAQGFGASVNSKAIGAYGDFAAFSFGRGKLFSIGEGGALICRTRKLYEKAVAFSQHPLRCHRDIDNKRMREAIDGVSMNFRMHPLIASLAIGQLDGLLAQNIPAQIMNTYYEAIRLLSGNGSGFFIPGIPAGAEPSGIAIPLGLESHDVVMRNKDVLNKLGYELNENPSIKPLHLTKTIQRHRLLGGRENIPLHFTHKKGSCPNTEKRCLGNHHILSLVRDIRGCMKEL